MANSETISNKSSNRPKTPCVDGPKRVGFARPTLIIPPPQMQRMHSTHSAGVIYTAGPGGPTPDMYGRKASMFVFDQFNGIRDFTMSTAKSGLGIGEKCSYWLYNKFRVWSRKWFTHWFLTIVLVLYTIGGAVGFVYIEVMTVILIYKKVFEPKKLPSVAMTCRFWSPWKCIKDFFSREQQLLYFMKLSMILTFYTIGPAFLFVSVEGHNEEKVKEHDIRRVRYILIRELRNLSLEMPRKTSDGEWEGAAVQRFIEFERHVIKTYQNHALLMTDPSAKLWTMWNAVVYCATIYTTIGYGHLYPTTITGQALTIVYSIIGIPLFLIALTDFGKLFTRGIKFLWSFVRRVYYTGSCRSVRKTAHVQEIFKGAQMMYDIATFRRSSQNPDAEDPEDPQHSHNMIPDHASYAGTTLSVLTGDDTPTTPAISNFEIDDEFNLPISVALFILISYIFVGALGYKAVEGWGFFASFYFVFISMSTIGFGDYVPKQPLCMILSIVYLVFGLALMSMCINVVQEKLSETFKQASNKLGASIGFEMDENNSVITADHIEMPGVHAPKTP